MEHRTNQEGIVNTNRAGDLSEMHAATALLDSGLEVFRNISCSGPVDIVALDVSTGDVHKYDVKSATVNNDTKVVYLSGAVSDKYAFDNLGVKLLHVIKLPHGAVVGEDNYALECDLAYHGYTLTKNIDSKALTFTRYTMDKDCDTYDFLGQEEFRSYCGLSQYVMNKILYKGESVDGWSLIDKRPVVKYRLSDGSLSDTPS